MIWVIELLAFFGVSVGSIQDIYSQKVTNWIFFFILLMGFSVNPFFDSLVFSLGILFLGFFGHYFRFFGAGDSKILAAFGALYPDILFLAGFFMLSFFFFFVYGLFYLDRLRSGTLPFIPAVWLSYSFILLIG